VERGGRNIIGGEGTLRKGEESENKKLPLVGGKKRPLICSRKGRAKGGGGVQRLLRPGSGFWRV